MSVFILNFQGIQSLEDCEYYYDNRKSNLNLLIDDTMFWHFTEWTVPEKAQPGDIVIFGCARTASNRLSHVRAQAKQLRNFELLDFLNEQMSMYKIYAGKLMVIGVVAEGDANDDSGWNLPMREIINMRMFHRPIDTGEIKKVIKLNTFGSVTHLDDMQWAYLRDYINRSELESQVKYMHDISNYDLLSIEWQKKKKKVSAARKERNKMNSKIRYSVLKRDGFRCVICGRTAEDGVTLHVDHIKPIVKGGLTEMDNLRTLCLDCNEGKGASWDEGGLN